MDRKWHPSGIVTLLTDFGEQDWYVAAMKGVILSRFPSCRLVDISHDIPPGEVFSGSYVLSEAFHFFPEGTVHVAVVDPGVGGKRRALAATAEGHLLLGPDNGLLSLSHRGAEGGSVRAIRQEKFCLEPLSRTFHGRDLFAPVAALMAQGGNPHDLGPEIRGWTRLEFPAVSWEGGALMGKVIHTDRFGNGITNLTKEDVRERFGDLSVEVTVGNTVLRPIRGTYTDVPPGEALALVGSSGRVEISVNGGSARAQLGLQPGVTSVTVRGS
jgi:S-adenosylmethionine hydrolase